MRKGPQSPLQLHKYTSREMDWSGLRHSVVISSTMCSCFPLTSGQCVSMKDKTAPPMGNLRKRWFLGLLQFAFCFHVFCKVKKKKMGRPGYEAKLINTK